MALALLQPWYMRVIVAGAGLAGLTAAHELKRSGASVTIVEARRRAGGADANDPVTWVSWEHEQYTGGGYGFLDPGFDPAWRPLLSRRAGRVVFAGEHTSDDWQGYMEGAVRSGLQAARKLLERPA